ncbi:MAG: hypothetical protein DRQ47_05720, partial [Gammaproteobacteria bacterium]
NHRDPNTQTFSESSPSPHVPLAFTSMDNFGGFTLIDGTVIPRKYNDVGGSGVTDLPVGKSTIHRFYSIGLTDGNRKYILEYGQTLYDSAEIAKSNILIDSMDSPDEIDNMRFVSYICVSESALNFDNTVEAWIISANNYQTTSGTGETKDHKILVNRDALDQHPMVAIGDGTPEGQLPAVLASKMNWRGRWFPGIYALNDVTTDGPWTMVANQETSEQPSPQDIGVPLYGMPIDTVFNVAENTSIIKVQHDYIFTKKGYFELVSIHVPSWDLNVVSKITIYDINADVAVIINNPILTPDGWTDVALGSFIVDIGSHIAIQFSYYNSSTASEINGGWNSSINAATVPADKAYNVSNVSGTGTFVIDHTDLDDVEHTIELRNVAVGSIINLVESADSTRNLEIRTTTVDQTPAQVYSTYGYDFIGDGSKGPIRDGRVTSVVIHTPIEQPSQYSQLTDYYLSGGANQPDFADVTTKLFYGNQEQADVDDGYGINIRFQEASRSDHWDILAYGGDTSGSGGGGEGSDGIWGLIAGDIEAQTDLIEKFATKEPLINTKLTAFNKDFGVIADTVCEGDDSRLSDSRDPTAHNHDDLYYTESESDTMHGQAMVTMSETAPLNPVDGQEWLDTSTNRSYSWYTTGAGEWVEE